LVATPYVYSTKSDGEEHFHHSNGVVPGDQASDLQLLIDSTPSLIHTSRPDGYLDFFNQNWLTFVGRVLEDLQGWKWTAFIHTEDSRNRGKVGASLPAANPSCMKLAFCAQTRISLDAAPQSTVADGYGQIVKWCGSTIDIEIASERKDSSAEAPGAAKKRVLSREGQRLAHMGSWAFDPAGFDYWSPELFRMHGFDPACKPLLCSGNLDVSTTGRESMANLIRDSRRKFAPSDAHQRIVRPMVRSGTFAASGLLSAKTRARKSSWKRHRRYGPRARDQELDARRPMLAESPKTQPDRQLRVKPDSGEIVWTDETYRIFEYDRAEKPTLDMVFQRIHPLRQGACTTGHRRRVQEHRL